MIEILSGMGASSNYADRCQDGGNASPAAGNVSKRTRVPQSDAARRVQKHAAEVGGTDLYQCTRLSACPRLLPHHRAVCQHLHDSRSRRQQGQFLGRSPLELPALIRPRADTLLTRRRRDQLSCNRSARSSRDQGTVSSAHLYDAFVLCCRFPAQSRSIMRPQTRPVWARSGRSLHPSAIPKRRHFVQFSICSERKSAAARAVVFSRGSA